MRDDEQFFGAAASALVCARERLLAHRCEAGFWPGELSSSALSTAVAARAMHAVDSTAHAEAIAQALRWLVAHANADGGWGDTPESPSNLSATILAWSALFVANPEDEAAAQARAAGGKWVESAAGGLEPERLAAAILDAYGQDRTFSAPILTLCAITGRLGDDPWQWVPQLPFEWAVFPHSLFRFLRLSVVSYAIPALIAIGLARHAHPPASTPVISRIRTMLTSRVLRILTRCQPAHGGFLDAAPLTSFVALGLVAAGFHAHPVTARCAHFLKTTVRPDGSWPIDTNLSVWITTLAINTLAEPSDSQTDFTGQDRQALSIWLLSLQGRVVHPFTHAAPGGWGWTHLPGSVPDADDTAGALLALRTLHSSGDEVREAVLAGLRWLLDLQNADGGMPTFCRGWGRLPFDRSCPDITAHAIRAFDVWYGDVSHALQLRLDAAMHAAVQYLQRAQGKDGSWVPLWFGNQHTRGQTNLTYGTAQVLIALNRLSPGRLPLRDTLVVKGTRWLLANQQDDGGWGGSAGVPATLEETALAVQALVGVDGVEKAVQRGVMWLVRVTAGGTCFPASPIGLYFARLWYSERLYPVIFTTRALAAWCQHRQALKNNEKE